MEFFDGIPYIKKCATARLNEKFASFQKLILYHCQSLIVLNLRSLTSMYIESQRLEKFEIGAQFLPCLGRYSRLSRIQGPFSRMVRPRWVQEIWSILAEYKKEIISLGYNRLKVIPKFIYELSSIQIIYLNNNKIKTLQVERGSLIKLEGLDWTRLYDKVVSIKSISHWAYHMYFASLYLQYDKVLIIWKPAYSYHMVHLIYGIIYDAHHIIQS